MMTLHPSKRLLVTWPWTWIFPSTSSIIFELEHQSVANMRPLVVKFACLEKKKAMLLKAKKLKGMEKWTGVVVTHDMTKLECQMEKAWEIKLRQDAEFMNSSLSVVERSVNCQVFQSL